MEVEAFELRRIALPLAIPFRSAGGTEAARDILLVRAVGRDGEGWGECVALEEPTYTSEYVDGAHLVLSRHLIPRLSKLGDIRPEVVGSTLAAIQGHRMAKAALEAAVLDGQLRSEGRSLAAYLGAARREVDSGVAVGIVASIDELVDAVRGYVEAGYRRVKLKIQPGWDLQPAAAVRAAVGPDLLVHVDANGCYSIDDASHLARLDELGLTMIEQPLPAHDLRGHAELARRLATPICLDESIRSTADAAEALLLKACSIINIKAGRVGGLLEAKRLHDFCRDRGVMVWCGGMLETGVGRAANLALAALPGFGLPADISASARYYAEDVTEPFVINAGRIAVPAGPGIGVTPDPGRLAACTRSVETIGVS